MEKSRTFLIDALLAQDPARPARSPPPAPAALLPLALPGLYPALPAPAAAFACGALPPLPPPGPEHLKAAAIGPFPLEPWIRAGLVGPPRLSHFHGEWPDGAARPGPARGRRGRPRGPRGRSRPEPRGSHINQAGAAGSRPPRLMVTRGKGEVSPGAAVRGGRAWTGRGDTDRARTLGRTRVPSSAPCQSRLCASWTRRLTPAAPAPADGA